MNFIICLVFADSSTNSIDIKLDSASGVDEIQRWKKERKEELGNEIILWQPFFAEFMASTAMIMNVLP